MFVRFTYKIDETGGRECHGNAHDSALKIPHGDHVDMLIGNVLHHITNDGCQIHGELQSILDSSQPDMVDVVLPEESVTSVKQRRFQASEIVNALSSAVIQAQVDQRTLPAPARRKQRLCDRDVGKFAAMLFLTGSFMFVELVTGIITGSIALQADAFHMLSDVISLGVGFYAVRATKRSATATATFGFARFEVVGALINGVFLLATCLGIVIEVIQRLIAVGHDEDTESDAKTLMIVAGVGLGINLIGLVLFSTGHGHGHSHGGGGHGHSHGNGHGHSHAAVEDLEHGHSHSTETSQSTPSAAAGKRKAKRNINMNVHGVLLHVLGDALGSVAVLIAGSIMHFSDWPRKELADPLASLIIVGIIMAGSLPLVRRSVHILLQKAPMHVDVDSVKAAILRVDGVLSVHDFHVWQLDSNKVVGSLHVMVDRRMKDLGKLQDSVKAVLHTAGIHASTIQPEYLRPELQQQLEQIRSLTPTAGESAATQSPLPTFHSVVQNAQLDACEDIVCGDSCVMSTCCPPETTTTTTATHSKPAR